MDSPPLSGCVGAFFPEIRIFFPHSQCILRNRGYIKAGENAIQERKGEML